MDPGVNYGIAILDTKGEIIFLKSMRDAKKAEIIKMISEFGNPVLIASDVNPLPKSVGKVGKSMGTRIFYPENSMTTREKEKMIEDYRDDIGDSHEKDALAAAVRAFKNQRELFQKIEHALKKRKSMDVFDAVVRKIFEGSSDNILDAVNKILDERNEK